MALPTDRLATIEDVAAHLGVTARVVRQIVRKYYVPVLNTGRHIRFDDLALKAFFEALRQRSRQPAAIVLAPPQKSRSYIRYRDNRSTFDDAMARLTASLETDKQKRAKLRAERSAKACR